MPARVASLMLLMNPPFTMAWAFLVYDERLTPLDLFGGVVTLVCIYYGSEPQSPPKGTTQEGGATGPGLKGRHGQQEGLLARNDDEDA